MISWKELDWLTKYKLYPKVSTHRCIELQYVNSCQFKPLKLITNTRIETDFSYPSKSYQKNLVKITQVLPTNITFGRNAPGGARILYTQIPKLITLIVNLFTTNIGRFWRKIDIKMTPPSTLPVLTILNNQLQSYVPAKKNYSRVPPHSDKDNVIKF